MSARSAVLLAAALWCGLALGASLPPGAALGALALGALLAAWPRSLPRWDALLVTALAFGSLGVARAGAERALQVARERAVPAAGATVRAVAVVEEPPRREGDAPAAVVRVLAAEPALPRGLRARLRLPPGDLAEWGDTVDVLARLDPIPGSRNPGGFDARSAARAANVHASGRAWTCRVRCARALATLPIRLAMRVRRAAESALARELSPEARELVVPLVFGDRAGMSTDTDAALRGSGLVHLLALSGLHVAWLAGLARGLAALAGGGPLARSVAGALAAGAYALLAGPIPSLARAVVAEGVNALACGTRRAADALQTLALAPLVLLALAPAWAGDLGFQLSCAATAGLVAIGGPWSERAPRLPPPLRALVSGVLLTLGAQVAALPLLLARFHALPWTALGGNLVAVPVSEWLLAAAFLAAASDVLLPGSGHVAFAACETLARALHALTFALGAWPGALIATGASRAPVVAAAAGAALLALGTASSNAVRSRAARESWCAVACATGTACVAFACACALGTATLRPPPGRWWLVALDVGQGDALAIAGERGWWLVDTGPRSPRWDAGEGAVLPFLRWAGVRELQAVALTHDDGDHTGGALAVRRGMRVRQWLASAPRPGVPGPGARFGARALACGDTLAALAPLAIVRWPPRDTMDANARRGDNSAALVLEVGEGRGRALLMADADSLVEDSLVCGANPAVLKAGHHGSGSSSGAAFLARVLPRRVIVSVGARNPYGHPNAIALARLATVRAIVDRTDREGGVWYELDATGVRRLDWQRGEPRLDRAARAPAAGAAGAPREW